MIILKNILLKKGSKELLKLDELKILAGKVTVVLGSNGAGKSTLLKVLAGALTPDEGEVLLFGVKISEWAPRALARSRAMLSQHYSLPFNLLVKDLVGLGQYAQPKQSQSAEAIAEVLAAMQLEPLKDRIVQTLSGGEQQRTHMARVLLQLRDEETRPKLLLLDEPVSSLDIVHQQTILKMARQCAQRGYTVVMVLHDLNLAVQYADQFLILKKGRMVALTSELSSELLSDAFDTPMHCLTDSVQSRQYYFASDAR